MSPSQARDLQQEMAILFSLNNIREAVVSISPKVEQKKDIFHG